VAIVFGREDRGLTNEELGLCNFHVHIPSDPEYSSLNLSQAVQILAYEIRLAYLEEKERNEDYWDVDLANNEQTERLINHMDELMQEVDFYDTENPRKLLVRVRRFFKRSKIDVMEANIFRGFFATIQKKLK
jgi:tRNA (cytidine32/uridine32-2'-O)-methyltransferase